MQNWTYTSPYGVTRTTSLTLAWYLDGVSMSDQYDAVDRTAHELFDEWIRKYGQTDALLPIFWQVAEAGEPAPFQDHSLMRDHTFLDEWSDPVDADTGEPINWLTLPVADGVWRETETTKGGFLQEATGWKPSALQPSVSSAALRAAADSLRH